MDMKRSVFLALAILLSVPWQVGAQDVPSYLADESDASVRVEIVGVPTPLPPQTLWQKLQTFLGVRKSTVWKPDIGTKFTVNSSAYASSPYQTDSSPCITASGTRVRPGVVASNFLPIGTVLDINGLKFIVEDRMNPRYAGYFLDIWFPSTSEALEFGRRKLEITVIAYADAGTDVRIVATPTPTPVPKKLTAWENVQATLSNVTSLIGVRVSQDVNRYDVDCLAE